MSDFEFEFSLEVLNHLGRGLYRNFATVVAEAISNSWDAEATEVRIFIKQGEKEMTISDNGKGMNEDDFQGKFLRVGYSRRDDENNKSKRKVLGRKGIGKLAMLSISEKVTVISRKKECEVIGGLIDNAELDGRIKDDSKYSLENFPEELQSQISEHGTYIKFEGIKETVNNPELIKKYLAVLFNFSFSSPAEEFSIYVNDDKVSMDDLSELNNKTQFLWRIDLNEKNASDLNNRFTNIKNSGDFPKHSFETSEREYLIKGFVASVETPKVLKIHGTGGDFKAGLHLFVNGRLRQEDIFQDIASQRIVESYLYGEIHVDGFDGGKDIFTSNREGVIKDSDEYIAFLERLKDIQRKILDDWDKWRRELTEKKIGIDNKSKYRDLKPEKRKAIKRFIAVKEDDDLKGKFDEFLKAVIPKSSDKKVLISHASADEKLANKVYASLLEHGFEKEQILYTSSPDIETHLPGDTNIFDYLREFFIQDWKDNPPVIFVVSKNLEQSWFSSLEAGAAWVTKTKHKLVVAKGHVPKKPLNPNEHLYITFDADGGYANKQEANRMFQNLAKTHSVP